MCCNKKVLSAAFNVDHGFKSVIPSSEIIVVGVSILRQRPFGHASHFDFATSHFPLGFEFQLLCDQNLRATYASFCETFDGVGVRCRTGYCGDDGGGDNDTDHSGLYYDHEEMDGDRGDDGEQGDSDAFRGCVDGGRGGGGDGGDGGDGGRNDGRGGNSGGEIINIT